MTEKMALCTTAKPNCNPDTLVLHHITTHAWHSVKPAGISLYILYSAVELIQMYLFIFAVLGMASSLSYIYVKRLLNVASYFGLIYSRVE